MGLVKDKVTDPAVRPQVIKDCAALVDAEVARKKGVTGMMIKTGYKAFVAIKPGIVEQAVDVLLDDFADKLDAQYARYLQAAPDGSPTFEQWAQPRAKDIANDLLGVTDAMMARSSKVAIKKIYNSLRKIAQDHVAQAVPAVARLVMRYASAQ